MDVRGADIHEVPRGSGDQQVAPLTLATLPAAVRDARRIMSLCDTAISELGEARTLDDVLGIKNTADAFEVYARKLRASHEAQTACAQVTLLAEARIGSELRAAQERGEVTAHGANQHNEDVRGSDILPATFLEIGIPSQRAAEYRALAVAGTDAIREEVATATKEGRRPSGSRLHA